MSPSKILFFMSGSIAAFKACQVLSRLVQDGHDVQVVATKSTFNFIGAATLEGLSGKKVLSDLFENGRAMDHIHLTRWADFGLLCPASANTLARMAHGLADDLVSAMALAWPAGKPFTVVPAMNHQMLAAPVTQANLRRLQDLGFTVAPTANGSLACGEEGGGRMLEPEQILAFLEKPARGRVLITGGATREPIDGIRFLSNVSTGQTAATLCAEFAARGWQVTYLHGEGARPPSGGVENIVFSSFQDLNEKLRTQLSREDFTAVIHAAAVSDYSVANARPDVKLSSDQDLHLDLKRNFKILPRLREYSRRKDIRVIGFKLTLGDDGLEAARRALGPAVDAVVANEWRSVERDRSRHPGVIVRALGETRFENLNELSSHLEKIIFPQGDKHDSLS